MGKVGRYCINACAQMQAAYSDALPVAGTLYFTRQNEFIVSIFYVMAFRFLYRQSGTAQFCAIFCRRVVPGGLK